MIESYKNQVKDGTLEISNNIEQLKLKECMNLQIDLENSSIRELHIIGC